VWLSLGRTPQASASSGVYLLELSARLMVAPCVCLKHDAEMPERLFRGSLQGSAVTQPTWQVCSAAPLSTSCHYPGNPSSHRSAELTIAGTTGVGD